MALTAFRCFARPLLASVLTVSVSSIAFALDPVDQEGADVLRRVEQRERSIPKPGEKASAEQAPAIPQGACFKVKRVIVEGGKLLSNDDLQSRVADLAGKCIGLKDINDALKTLTYAYLDRGYIAARAYVPAQNMGATKQLRLAIIEGNLEAIYKNGEPAPSEMELKTAFPNLLGKPVNIRDVEQGLDQMNTLASNDAKSDLLPGKQAGGSILNVTNKADRRIWGKASYDNMGSRSTGFAQSTLTAGLDDPLHLNDSWQFSYARSGEDFAFDKSGGHSSTFSGRASVPYGYWTLGLHGNYYDYTSYIAGLIGDVRTTGDSRQFGGDLSRVVHRDGDSKTSLMFSLDYKASNNFLLGNRIETGTRQYSIGAVSLDHSQRALGALWTAGLRYSHGLNLLGASHKSDPGMGGADPTFGKTNIELSVLKPFSFGPAQLELSSTWAAQWSNSQLLGSEQISLGGFYNVRGLREAESFGNTGFYGRNELAWRAWSPQSAELEKLVGEIRPYAAFDFGRIIKQDQFDIGSEGLAGISLGIRNQFGRMAFDLGYSDIIYSTAKNPRKTGLFYANGEIKF